MKLKSGYEKRRARVEMIPLIDVVFLLLVFFMYAMLSMTLHRGLKVDLQETEHARIDRKDYVSITVTARNEVYLDGDKVSLEELAGRIIDPGGGGEKKPVYIRGDERASHGVIVRILDTLRGAGIREVTVESEESRR